MRHLNRIVRPLLALVITGGAIAFSAPTVTADDQARAGAVPAAKDGLTVRVATAHPVFAADQQPVFDVSFTNQRDAAFRLAPGISMVDMWTITAEETTSGAAYRLNSIQEFRRRVREITTLSPKESRIIHLDFSRFQFIHLQQEQAEKPLSRLPAGKYRLTIVMKFEAIFDTPESVKPAAWIGELKTDAVMFEIAGK